MKRSGRKSKAPGKPRARKGKAGRRPRSKRTSNVPDIASCSVKRTILDAGGQPFVVNRMYDVHNVQLQQYDRAVQIAQAYQFFRIKKIAVTLKVGYDTYQAGAGAATRPNLYYMFDKSQSIPLTVTLEGLKQMGARPHAIDNKPFTMAWAPTVLTEEQTLAGAVPAQYKVSPWLNTNNNNLGAFVASAVQHNGLYWYTQMDATGGVNYQYTAEIEVQFEFKKPLWTNSTSATPSKGISFAPLNNSPDGIVGGEDEKPQIGY